MKISNKILFVLILAVFFSFNFNFVFGQSGVTAPTGDTGSGVTAPTGATTSPSSSGIFTIQNPLKVDSIGGLINLFVELFTYLVILLAVLMFIYVGFKYVLYSSQGNTKGISELHSQLFWLVVGVAVVIGARFIIEIIINTLSATGAISPGVIDSANNAIRPK